jgi:hypothetical protein
MAEPFVFIITLRIKPSQRDEFKALTREYMKFIEENEPRAWAHFGYLDATESEASLVAVHPDSASADQHLQVAGEKIGQGLALTDTVGIQVYGEPGPIVRRALEANAAEGVPMSIKSSCIGTFVDRPGFGGG